MEEIDTGKILEGFEKAKDLGHVNIVLAGKTGVGKSTLLNAIFGEDLAEVGVGVPMTQHTTKFEKPDSPLVLYDTKGFELQDYSNILDELRVFVNKQKTDDPNQHIHVAWYCINDAGDRYEQAEIDFINELASSIPVVVVITKCLKKSTSFVTFCRENIKNARQVIPVLAQDCEIDEDYTKKSFGLSDLVNVTFALIPEAAKKAFAAAQQVSLEIKQKGARTAVNVAATAAAGACAIPLPFADSAALVPIQITMLASISHIMGLDSGKAFLSTLVATATGVLGAVVGGRAIVTGLLKLIPGAGTILGTVIGATTAVTLTKLMGEAYISALSSLIERNMELTSENVTREFKESLKLQKIKN